MKFYSEKTKQLYDDTKGLMIAEAEYEKKQREKDKMKEKRTERAKEIAKAIEEEKEARCKTQKLIADFVKDYGSFHYSTTNKDLNPVGILQMIFEML